MAKYAWFNKIATKTCTDGFMTIPTIEKYLKRCGPWVAIQESPVRHFKEYRRIHHLEIYIYKR